MNIIDRRLNPGGKSLANRQRFLRRARALVQKAVRECSSERGITDLERSGEIAIPADGVHEPRLRRSATGGMHNRVLPGNKHFIEGDTINRDSEEATGGGGAAGGDDEEQDDFRFVLTREEFLNIFLEDLELPDLVKRRLATMEVQGLTRAGYSVTGTPVNLALLRTMRNALSRRIAMARPKKSELLRLDEEIKALEQKGDPDQQLDILREKYAQLEQRRQKIPYVDPVDLRYRHMVPVERPIAQAAMFCLMDTSGSMTEHMKDLAKRFFMLLYIFLTRRYQHVEIVFIRHTHHADEVDEQAFFGSPETGGTVVSSALRVMQRIIAERYPPENWNIYAAQASDGDNTPADNIVCATLLQDEVLPLCQYFAYLEVGAEEGGVPIGFTGGKTTLWRTYESLRKQGAVAMRRVSHRREIYPVFRDLFRRSGVEGGNASP